MFKEWKKTTSKELKECENSVSPNRKYQYGNRTYKKGPNRNSGFEKHNN